MKEIISNNFNVNINKEVVTPPLVKKEIISNSFIVDINKQLIIQNNPPSIANIKVLNVDVLGNFELQFDLIDKDNDRLDVFLKIGLNDYETILTNQESGTIKYKGTNMPSGTNICRLKVTDEKSTAFSEEFEIIIPQMVTDDIFESIELITDKNIKGGEYARVAIRLKSKATINNIKLNPKLLLPQGSVIKNAQWEKGTVMTDYRQSISEISSKTSELSVNLDGIKGSVEKIKGDYVTQSEMNLTSEKLEFKISQSGGYNLLYNGDFKRQFEHWESNSAYWQYGDKVYSPDGRCIYCEGALNTSRTVYYKGGVNNLDPRVNAYTLSYWINTSSSGSDGTTNPYRRVEVTMYYTDGTATWHSAGNQTKYDHWEKHIVTIERPADKHFSHCTIGVWVRDTTKRVYYSTFMLEKGTMATEWTPNPNETYDGITTIDKDGIRVTSTGSSTYTEMDADSFRVSDNNGGTVAEFSKESTIPYLTSGTISANNIYANNIPKKEEYGNIHFIYVNGSTGNETNNGSQSYPYKTVQRAINDISDIQNTNVTIYVYNSVNGFTLRGITGSGVITFSLQDSAVINSGIWLHGVENRVNITNEVGSRKPTLKAGISIDDCRQVDLYALTFRGVNGAGSNISINNTNYCAVNSCDLGGLSTQLMCAIAVRASLLWLHGCIGSKITDVVGQYAFSHVMMARAGTSNVPDYSSGLLVNYDGSGRIQNWAGGTFTKTPSSGWNPSYTPTQKTQVWSFNKI